MAYHRGSSRRRLIKKYRLDYITPVIGQVIGVFIFARNDCYLESASLIVFCWVFVSIFG